ncbi:MAG: chemotaxis protein CheW [Leptospirales bacterium]|nr:chemotaxis protein CheW [Leptospirales bacterium]
MSEAMRTTGIVPETVENANDEKYLIFSILDRCYAIPSQFISELAVFDAVYPLPLVPDYMLGIINRYSVPYALLDIGLLLYKTPSTRKKTLVLKDNIDRIAFLIDDIVDIADIPQNELLNIERKAESYDASEMLSASFKWSGSDVFVLDIHRVLALVSSETEA